jgi:predicted SprT family Zn-dependent metalloprotease
MRPEFKDFVDGKGAWKWSTDQTLLNYWVRKEQMNIQKLDWKWNALFTAVESVDAAHFIHFFLKDKLPHKGEDVHSLMEQIC